MGNRMTVRKAKRACVIESNATVNATADIKTADVVATYSIDKKYDRECVKEMLSKK